METPRDDDARRPEDEARRPSGGTGPREDPARPPEGPAEPAAGALAERPLEHGERVQIAGSDQTAKLRGPIWVGVWSFLTVFIYAFYWYYQLNKELAAYGRARRLDLGDSPGLSLLAVSLGALVVVPALVSLYNTGKRLQGAQREAGREPLNGWLGLVLFLVLAPALLAYYQDQANGVWRGQAQLPAPGP